MVGFCIFSVSQSLVKFWTSKKYTLLCFNTSYERQPQLLKFVGLVGLRAQDALYLVGDFPVVIISQHISPNVALKSA